MTAVAHTPDFNQESQHEVVAVAGGAGGLVVVFEVVVVAVIVKLKVAVSVAIKPNSGSTSGGSREFAFLVY